MIKRKLGSILDWRYGMRLRKRTSYGSITSVPDDQLGKFLEDLQSDWDVALGLKRPRTRNVSSVISDHVDTDSCLL
jgi:hypothetical protein